jgi:hypothetical protein
MEKSYLYQIPLDEFDSPWKKYLEGDNKGNCEYKGQIIVIDRDKLKCIFNLLKYYHEKYVSEIKKIIEVNKMSLENINDLMKYELYIFNILEMYCIDDYFFYDGLKDVDYVSKFIHDIDADIFYLYFESGNNLKYKRILGNLFQEKCCS